MNADSPQPAVGWSTFKTEWSLWCFTSIAIFSWLVCGRGRGTDQSLCRFLPPPVLAMAVSALHLGGSPASGGDTECQAVVGEPRGLALFDILRRSLHGGFPARGAGFAEVGDRNVGVWRLFAMDMVYRVRGQPTLTVPHSAMAMLTAAFYIGILTTIRPVWPAATVKLVLYLARRERPVPGGAVLAPLRIGIGLFPAFALAATGDCTGRVAMFGAVIGELIDRAEFYAGLRFLTPTHQIEIDLMGQQVTSI